MRLQIFHHDQRLRRIEMEHLRHRTRRAGGLPDQCVMFIKRAVQGQGPAFADQPDIRQRLLHDQRAPVRRDDEHQVQIAVAHLAHGPVLMGRPQPVGHRRHSGQSCAQSLRRQGRVIAGLCHISPRIALAKNPVAGTACQ